MISNRVRTSSIATVLLVVPAARANTYFTKEPGTCHIVGDPDVYGIGIRLGYYFQFAAALLCLGARRLDDLNGARNGFNAFSIAIFINLLRNAHRTLPIEWYIVFLLGATIPSSTIDTDTVWMIQVFFVTSFLLVFPWLAWKAIDIGRKPGCEIVSIFFGKVYLYDRGWRIVLKVFSCIAVFVFGSMFIFALGMKCYLYQRKRRKDLERQNTEPDTFRPLGKHHESGLFSFAARLKFSYPGFFAIAFIEATLAVNNVDMSSGPITAAGQLIPLIIGIYVFALTVGGIVWEYRREHEKRLAGAAGVPNSTSQDAHEVNDGTGTTLIMGTVVDRRRGVELAAADGEARADERIIEGEVHVVGGGTPASTGVSTGVDRCEGVLERLVADAHTGADSQDT